MNPTVSPVSPVIAVSPVTAPLAASPVGPSRLPPAVPLAASSRGVTEGTEPPGQTGPSQIGQIGQIGQTGQAGQAGQARRTGAQRANLALLVLSVTALALISGFFYAYACSVMVGLAEVDDPTFISTMQAINATVRNWGFAPSFFGAFLVTAVAVAALAPRWRSLEWQLLVGALVVYAVGGLGLTMFVSVPLNDELAAAGPVSAIADPAAVRADYEGPWVTWNLVRTVCSTVAFLLAVTALYRLGHATRPQPAN